MKQAHEKMEHYAEKTRSFPGLVEVKIESLIASVSVVKLAFHSLDQTRNIHNFLTGMDLQSSDDDESMRSASLNESVCSEPHHAYESQALSESSGAHFSTEQQHTWVPPASADNHETTTSQAQDCCYLSQQNVVPRQMETDDNSQPNLTHSNIWTEIKADEDTEQEHLNALATLAERRSEKMNFLYGLIGGGREQDSEDKKQELEHKKRVQELERALAASKKEIWTLKHDLKSLKQTITTLSTTSNEVADDELKARMEDIYQLSVSWIRMSFRKPTTSECIYYVVDFVSLMRPRTDMVVQVYQRNDLDEHAETIFVAHPYFQAQVRPGVLR